MSRKNTVFIQANARQMLGAKISALSFKKASAHPDRFDVVIMDVADYPRLLQPGQTILRNGNIREWDPDDLQSFTPMRFAPPKLMGYQGRAVVVDPDCFALGDVNELFDRDMEGKALMAVPRPGHNDRKDYIASSVMLLDCAALDWDVDQMIDDLFAKKFDYSEWIKLGLQPLETIGFLEPEWNDFDRLRPTTKILHTTKRRTQPWKTGLPIDFTVREKGPLDFLRNRFYTKQYQQHPDPNQEALVYSLLAELYDSGAVTRPELEAEMAANHVRHDSLELIERHRGWNGLSDAA